MDEITTNSVWRGKYKTLKDYYNKAFNKEYFIFDKYEMEVDPDETVESMSAYDPQRQRIETAKCALSFSYFCTKYIKILHPKKGLIPFILYKYQRDVIESYEQHRFNIIRKFRQGGLTTVTEMWGLWRCLFKLDQQILFLSKTDSEAVVAGEIVNTAAKHLPSWMQPSKDGKWNDHQKHFPETGGKMVFGTPERARGLAITYLILDEAAFIPDMETYWKAMYPTLSTGGSCIVVSTVNGLGNWYEETYHAAQDKKNDFHIIDLEYTRHPDYNNPKWVKEQKSQLGEKGWQQEVLGSFLGSGETYIPSHIISELQSLTRNNYPKRKKFKKWANTSFNPTTEEEWQQEGALWIWKEPKDGHEYIIGVDAAEGVGDDGDNSCIEVIDQSTLEQVAEFYSNLVPPYIFAQIINEMAIFYNHALVVVENNGPGGAILSNLQNELFYDNLFFENNKSKLNRPGIRMNVTNRPVFLEALQHRLMNGTIRVNSRRFVKELNTFNYNAQTQKAEAQKGKHDDAIISMCLALFVRDSVMREVPMGADVPKELASPFQTSIYEEIKREIMDGSPKDLVTPEVKDMSLIPDDEDIMAGVVYSVRRKMDKLLKSFGWLINPLVIISYDEVMRPFFKLIGNFFSSLL